MDTWGLQKKTKKWMKTWETWVGQVCKFYHISFFFFFFLENSSQVGSLWNVVNMEVIESACELKCPSTNVSPIKK